MELWKIRKEPEMAETKTAPTSTLESAPMPKKHYFTPDGQYRKEARPTDDVVELSDLSGGALVLAWRSLCTPNPPRSTEGLRDAIRRRLEG